MSQFRDFPFYAYTADDVADAERDLAALQEQYDAETDPGLRQMLADWIECDSAFLAEMTEAVFPPLPFPVAIPSMPWRLHP